MNYSALDDQTLIRLIVQAQTKAMSELYDRYSSLVFGQALNVVGDSATAEEITLDVFTRVWEQAGTYRAERAQVRTWLMSITRHRAIDILRQRDARPEQYSLDWAENTSHPTSNRNNPEEITELSLRRTRVRAAVEELPEDQQQALALAFFKGYTHRQIADILDQPLGTVKTRIRLAMQKLRKMLQDEILSL